MAGKRKTVLVTGASHGIGVSVAALFLERGADKAPTRMVSGVSSLPAGASVVVELILSVAVGDR